MEDPKLVSTRIQKFRMENGCLPVMLRKEGIYDKAN
jgi:hypothetical protein